MVAAQHFSYLELADQIRARFRNPDATLRELYSRIMFNIGLDRDNWALMLRPWIRVSDGDDDDNPGIEDYIGRGDITLVHRHGGNEFALMARHSLRGGDRSRGASTRHSVTNS